MSARGLLGRAIAQLRRLGILQIGLGLAVATVVSSWLILAVIHANDRFRVDFVSGTWMALADYAARGTLYPPLYDDGYYGGTRYMPLPVLLDAGASKVTGELLVSAKLVTYLVAVAIVALGFAVLRQVRCPGLLSLALLAAVVVTPTGIVGTLGIRNDGLAVALQLGACFVVLRSERARTTALAGVLVALAIFSKVSAIWGVVAIGIWLFYRRRSLVLPFLASFAGTVAALGIAFQLLSEGRFVENIVRFTFAGGRGPLAPLTEGVQALVTNFATSADAVWLLMPIAAVAVVLSVRSRALTLVQIALLVDLVVLSVVMGSRGTDHNHLLDLCVLTVLVVGEFAGSREATRPDSFVTLLVAAAVLWGVFSSYQRLMGSQALGALQRVVRGTSETNIPLDANPLAGFVHPGDRILSEDPAIPLSLGQRPVLLDAFAAKYAFKDHPERAHALEARVAAKEFDKIVLVAGLYPQTEEYDEQFLGPIVNRAVLANYRLAHAVPDFYVYLPLEADATATPAAGG